MAISRVLPAALGGIALLPTTGTLAVHIVLARSSVDRTSAVRVTAILTATVEAAILVVIVTVALSHVARWAPIAGLRRLTSLWFAAGLLLCTVGVALSVASLICLGKVNNDPQSTILGSRVSNFLVGSSVALGLAFATQLVFFVIHFLAGQTSGNGIQFLGHPSEGRKRSGPPVKSIPYHETSPFSAKIRGSSSLESLTPPGSSGGRSAAETMTSIRSSFSNAIQPITSRTRLLSMSQRFSHRPPSLDLPAVHLARKRSSDGFDSWDTSSVDPQNRQTVLESSSSPPPLSRFLETIPASPTTSRSPSPGRALDMDLPEPPPSTRRRSRSYSPASTRTIQAQRAAFTQQTTQSESHIHPLFRSDSPTPPPIATPGTVVVAAPNGGQVISDRQSIRSIRSMRRLRSESLPPVPSPLSRATSCDSLHRRAETSTPEIREEDELEVVDETGRKMTPPIPEWVLSAGA